MAYVVYWIGDMADGWAARRLGQETRLGAVLDIVSDRACTSVLCVGLLTQLPAVLPLAVVFLLSFMVLDTMLSLSFLCWPLVSPNDFRRVDRRVWLLNWSAGREGRKHRRRRDRHRPRRLRRRPGRRPRRGRRQGMECRPRPEAVPGAGAVSWLVPGLLAVATGFGSALLPFVNAEVYAVAAAGRSRPELAVALILCLAVGQTIGKLVLFETARRGSGRLVQWIAKRRRTPEDPGPGRWTRRITTALGSRRTGLPLVLSPAPSASHPWPQSAWQPAPPVKTDGSSGPSASPAEPSGSAYSRCPRHTSRHEPDHEDHKACHTAASGPLAMPHDRLRRRREVRMTWRDAET